MYWSWVLGLPIDGILTLCFCHVLFPAAFSVPVWIVLRFETHRLDDFSNPLAKDKIWGFIAHNDYPPL
jgi:hypothetical protein